MTLVLSVKSITSLHNWYQSSVTHWWLVGIICHQSPLKSDHILCSFAMSNIVLYVYAIMLISAVFAWNSCLDYEFRPFVNISYSDLQLDVWKICLNSQLNQISYYVLWTCVYWSFCWGEKEVLNVMKIIWRITWKWILW